jgi:hypothetical protein
MTKWLRIFENNVAEIVDYDPAERGVNEAFLSQFMEVSNSTEVEVGWSYDSGSSTFTAPPEPPEEEPPEEEPSAE